MPKINPYLNFDGNAEEAFIFYKSVFGGEFQGVHKMEGAPGTENLPENEKNRIMHISLPIGNGDLLMASDIMPSMGQTLNLGNNNYISVFADSREQADHLFNGLSAGGTIEMPLEDAFWGDYFGAFEDKYGVRWMINYPSQNATM
nr:VOC family protein [uncultured Dyadobacter sp.]